MYQAQSYTHLSFSEATLTHFILTEILDMGTISIPIVIETEAQRETWTNHMLFLMNVVLETRGAG